MPDNDGLMLKVWLGGFWIKLGKTLKPLSSYNLPNESFTLKISEILYEINESD